ncbi:General transcription factor II-I repeat domain containing protein 2A [Dissostichus eleginoides]|uniref:General transcription factor II-I repeat domain containing protein 2A n=1 Tax=Dissostichus eleginoides TaxID=100907 RepID=A0AAD9C1I9_DISEL|nr:General transcription factor II-I repeat domain containing protein 2A [Dissostichus eleginoides]
MNAFVTKLTLFKDGFSADPPNLAHFPSCEEMRKDAPECEKTLPKYRADIETLQQQFKKRFQDFHTMQPRIELFTNPLSAAIIEQPPELQLEMCELQSDPFLAKRQERGISFWRLLPVPLSTPQGFCALNGQHVWQHLHLREQLLYDEAHQVKGEKQTDR